MRDYPQISRFVEHDFAFIYLEFLVIYQESVLLLLILSMFFLVLGGQVKVILQYFQIQTYYQLYQQLEAVSYYLKPLCTLLSFLYRYDHNYIYFVLVALVHFVNKETIVWHQQIYLFFRRLNLYIKMNHRFPDLYLYQKAQNLFVREHLEIEIRGSFLLNYLIAVTTSFLLIFWEEIGIFEKKLRSVYLINGTNLQVIMLLHDIFLQIVYNGLVYKDFNHLDPNNCQKDPSSKVIYELHDLKFSSLHYTLLIYQDLSLGYFFSTLKYQDSKPYY